MKKIIICLILIFSLGPICAQDINFEYSKEEGVNGSINLSANKKFVFLLSEMRTFDEFQFVSKFSLDDMNFVYKKMLKAPKINDKKSEFIRVFLVQNNCYLASFQYDKKLKKTNVFATLINDDGALSAVSKLINQFDGEPYNKNFELSDDQSKILSYADWNYKMLDANLNTLWEKKINFKQLLKLPGEWSFAPLQLCCIDKNENLYFTAAIKVKKEKNITNKILKYDILLDSLYVVDIKYGENYLTQIQIKLDKNNNVICTGFYSKTLVAYNQSIWNFSEATHPDGIFLYTINMALSKIANIGIYNINEKCPNEALRDLYIDQFLIRENGDVVISAESRQILPGAKHSSVGGYDSYTATQYLFDNLLVASFDSSANPIWFKNIPKCQSGSYAYSSYALLLNKEDIKIVFNDAKKNLEGKPVGVKPDCMFDDNMILHVKSIDNQGSLTTVRRDYLSLLNKTKKELDNLSLQNVYRNYIQIKDDQILIMKNKPAKITFTK